MIAGEINFVKYILGNFKVTTEPPPLLLFLVHSLFGNIWQSYLLFFVYDQGRQKKDFS